MKKVLLFTLLLTLSFYGFSQDKVKDSTQVKEETYVPTGIKFGVRGGYNISNVDLDDGTVVNVPNKHRNSFYIGFFANIGLSRTLSLMPELQFSPEGANDEKLHLDYIQAPVLLRIKMSEKLHIAAGPQVSIKSHKTQDGVKNMAYSAVGGFEYKINYALFADLRYTYGLRNIFDDASGNSATNTNIQIGIGYKF
ncbi:porin family protein [Seonamhaeicola sp. ML3]|uniref:porin family protein n=1 Tax=Seonamhaeicola sp. ML3 TaxID=2937786 RepID=UPI00200DBA83|nr:porin family protein [Seonamhaeicola sp. ML3]